uniref:Uncharacterized protein n=1 Tax=Rhizophora mucronata TaxID=61149 RepID=A0A2P2QV46_RHIMU
MSFCHTLLLCVMLHEIGNTLVDLLLTRGVFDKLIISFFSISCPTLLLCL